MAIAGDIIIKLAADFAEFVAGINQSQKSLDAFGKKAEGIAGQIEGVIKVIKGAAVVTALTFAVKAVIEELDRLETKFSDIAGQAKKFDVTFAGFEALRIAAIKSGIGVDELANSMTRLKGITDAAIQGNAGVIDSLNKLGVTILDHNGKQRTQEEINKRIAIAFGNMPASIDKLRLQYTLLGEAGEATDKKLRLLAEGAEDAGAKLAAFQVEEALNRIKAIDDRLKAATERFDLLKAAALLPLKAAALEGWAASLERLNQAIVANDLTKLQNLLATLFSTKALLELGFSALNPNSKPIEDQMATLAKEAAELQAKVDKGPAARGGGLIGRVFGTGDAEWEKNRERLYATYGEINRLKAAAGNFATEGNFQVPLPDPKGKNPSKVTTGGGGKGGGQSDLETVEALMVRYKAMQDAANDASRAVRADITTDIKDLSIQIEAKQAAAEAIAKLVSRGIKVPEGALDDLQKTIYLSKQAQAEQQRSLQYAVQADATNKRLSGSTEGLRDAVQNLNRQYVSGRLGVVAYERALAEVVEQQEHVRLQATRMDNNIGSLAAGFQDAALSYARANDNFAQGGQLFNAVTGAMGEGLDVLSGKSTKTFSQIASDFATMLTKMALQAALSPVLKYLSGSIGDLFGGMSNAGLPGSSYFGPPSPLTRAGGGAVTGGQPYWVGEFGPERFVPAGNGNIEPAGGGDVYVNIANYTDSKVSASKGKGPGGKTQINVIVEAVENQMAGRVSRGQGALGKTMEGTYGLQRVGR